jgi:hypothetical protein
VDLFFNFDLSYNLEFRFLTRILKLVKYIHSLVLRLANFEFEHKVFTNFKKFPKICEMF